MKVLVVTFVIAYFSATTVAFEVTRIKGIEGDVIGVLFDSDSNALIIARDPEVFELQRVYKLDSQKNVLFTIEVEDTITEIMVNDKNDFYVITWRPNISYFTLINIIRAGSSEMERIDYVDNLEDVFSDDEGNLMYNTGDLGVFFLKHNTTVPVRIKNLENFTMSSDAASITDKTGNTYLAGFVWDALNQKIVNNQLVVITAESKDEAPEAKIIEGLLDNSVNDYVEGLAVTSNNDVLISITDDETTGSLKKLSDGAIVTIFANERYQNYFTKTGKTRTVITACDYIEYVCRLSYLTLDDEIVQISNLQNQSSVAGRYKIEIDDDGSTFIAGFNVVDESTVEFLNYTDTRTVGVDFGAVRNVDDIQLDGKGNLWVLTDDGMYFIEKGSLEPVKVPDTESLLAVDIDIEGKTNEVFVSTRDGLFVVSN